MEISLTTLPLNAKIAVALVLITSGITKIFFSNNDAFIKNNNSFISILINKFYKKLKYIELIVAILILSFKNIGLTCAFILFIIYLFGAITLLIKGNKKPCMCLGSINSKPVNIFSIINILILLFCTTISFLPNKGEPGILGIGLYLFSILLMVK